MQATAKEFIIALDEGTTNAKAVVLDGKGKVSVKFSQPLAIQTPREGWVEQSGEALVAASLAVIAKAVAHVGAGKRCGAGYQQSTRNRHRLVSRQRRTH